MSVLVSTVANFFPMATLWALSRCNSFDNVAVVISSGLRQHIENGKLIILNVLYRKLPTNFKYLNKSYVYWTVHNLDSWIKVDQLDVTCFIISLFTAQHVSNVSTSIFRSLRPWTHYLPTGLDHLPAATAHTNTGYNITQSSAPDDGHMVARNMLSNY